MSDTRRTSTIMVTDPSGSSFRTLYSVPRRRAIPSSFSWAPDSATIAFSMYMHGYGRSDIWTSGADGSNLTRITHTARSEIGVAYSPDGSRFVTSIQDSTEPSAHLMEMNADGTDRQQVHEPGYVFEVAWGG